MEAHEITYRYTFGDGGRAEFPLRFRPRTFQLISLPDERPEWTALEFHQCGNCPLTPGTHPHCLLAVALIEPVARFAGLRSYSELAVEVSTEERSISFAGPAQDAISPLLGLLSAASGCPITTPFRAMARFHLPFANETETAYRAVTTYLLGQYFRFKSGRNMDLELSGLLDIYRNIEQVNTAMARRLRAAASEDSTVNAIVLLDMFAKSMPLSIQDSLEEFRALYDGAS